MEAHHDWDTSIVKGVIIMAGTYLILGFYMAGVDIDRPWINAIVPTVGFWLSTLSLDKIMPIYLRLMRPDAVELVTGAADPVQGQPHGDSRSNMARP